MKWIGDGILRLQLPEWLLVQYQRSHSSEQVRLLYLPRGQSGWYARSPRLSIWIFPLLGGLTGCDGIGFVYSQTNDRLWRKNRQSTSGSSCLGHDINRNWNYQWATPGGASTDPCAQDFKGKLPLATAADAN